jgi:hypothetical protein
MEGPNTGRLIHRFSRRREGLQRWLPLLGGILTLLFSLSTSIAAIFIAWDQIIAHGRAILLSPQPLSRFGLLIGIPLGLSLISISWLNWNNRVTLFSRGLFIRLGLRKQFFFWKDIHRFDAAMIDIKLAGRPFTRKTRIILTDNQGRTLRVPDRFENMEALAQEMRKFLLPVLMAHTEAALADGRCVRFHPHLTAKPGGLQIYGKTYPWHTLKIPQFEGRNVLLFHRNESRPLFKGAVKKIHNLDCMQHLLNAPPTKSA